MGEQTKTAPEVEQRPANLLHYLNLFRSRRQDGQDSRDSPAASSRDSGEQPGDGGDNSEETATSWSSCSASESEFDVSTLKHLSTSTPAMTAQAQPAEPPSPRLAKEAKAPTASKARQKKFHRHFPAVDSDEKVLNYYSCALIGDILLQGHLYITKNYFAFYSNVFGYVTKLLIPMLSVEKITKEKTARIIPNAVGIATSEDKHVFGSLMSRDSTYRYVTRVWQLARDDALSLAALEPDIVAEAAAAEAGAGALGVAAAGGVGGSDSDSSGTREGDSGRESPAMVPRIGPRHSAAAAAAHAKLAAGAAAVDKDAAQRKESLVSRAEAGAALVLAAFVRQRLGGLRAVPRQSALLLATTLLLVLLFLSAAVLLYRIDKVQRRYLGLGVGGHAGLGGLGHHHHHHHHQQQHHQEGGRLYGDLLHWQTQLHSESAGAVHDFLDANLDQIAKVRQSLEALSTLLVSTDSTHSNSNSNNNHSPAAQEAGATGAAPGTPGAPAGSDRDSS